MGTVVSPRLWENVSGQKQMQPLPHSASVETPPLGSLLGQGSGHTDGKGLLGEDAPLPRHSVRDPPRF